MSFLEMPADELKEVIRLHGLWLRGDQAGRRAKLARANLARANLTDADLTDADLARANLVGADLARADLARANLAGADLARANLAGADLAGADLARANLARANLTDADLAGARGNMREVKSAQFDTWPVTWTRDQAGKTTLQIGCQRHDLELWRKADQRWIAAMDGNASAWWAQYGAIVLALVDASPAAMWGEPA